MAVLLGPMQQNQTPDVGGPWASARDGHTGQMWFAACVKTASVAESHSHAGRCLVTPLVQRKKLSLEEVESLAEVMWEGDPVLFAQLQALPSTPRASQ